MSPGNDRSGVARPARAQRHAGHSRGRPGEGRCRHRRRQDRRARREPHAAGRRDLRCDRADRAAGHLRSPHPYRQRALLRERGGDRDARRDPGRRDDDRNFSAQPRRFVFRSPAGVPQGDGRAQLRRFRLPSADLHRAADRGNSRLRRAVRHPLVQVLHVRHAGHREVGHRRRAARRLQEGRRRSGPTRWSACIAKPAR